MIWIDAVKGISILWIVLFHFFNACANERYPWFIRGAYFSKFFAACAPHGTLGTLRCVSDSLLVLSIDFGYQAVGVFLVLSGIGLTYSLARFDNPPSGWSGWYRDRLLRLYPMYWTANLIYLAMPFAWGPEPIDHRFWLSLIGDRFFPAESLFYYLNPAWWYFGLLIQLYFVFPVLFRMLQKAGPAVFLIITGLVTLFSRYLLLCVFDVSGEYVQGAFFACRLWEFAIGMVIGLYLRRDRTRLEQILFGRPALLAGFAIYAGGFFTYHSTATYTFADPMFTTGLFVLLAHGAWALGRLRSIASMLAGVGFYSYGLYLIHQPLVLYFGAHLRGLSLMTFIGLACVIIPALTGISMELERFVNGVTERLLGGRSKTPETLEQRQRVS